jgi:hypothetical protein
MPIPNVSTWNVTIGKLKGPNLSSDTRDQLDAISGEVRLYLGQYTGFMSELKSVAQLVQESKELTEEQGDPQRVQELAQQIASRNTELTQRSQDITADAPKMANVVSKFKDVVAATAPKEGRPDLTATQQEGLRDSVSWLDDFASQMQAGKDGWLATEEWIKTAMGTAEVYGKSGKNFTGIRKKQPAGGGPDDEERS